jgi:acetyl esterase/lipase
MKRISIRHRSLPIFAALSLGFPLHANAGLLDSLYSLRSGSTSTSTSTSTAGATTLTYTPANWPQAKQGDLFLPADNGQARPVVLLLHGGAWQRGDKSSMSGLGRALAERGYAAFAINYRFAPGSTYPAQLQDMQEALRFLQQNAGKYRLDMNRLATWGYSAGGHLATLLAVQPISDLPPVRVAIAGAPPSDLAAPESRDASSVKIFMGGSYSQLPALYEQASPRRQVRAGMAPVFLYHGTADTTVPPVQTQNFETSLKAAGVPVQVKWLQGLTHSQASGATTQYRPLALDFLDKHISGTAGTVVTAPLPGAPVVSVPDTTTPVVTAPTGTTSGGTLDRLRALLGN